MVTRASGFSVMVLATALVLGGSADAVTIHVAGWSAAPLASLYLSTADSPNDIDLDGAGNLYVAVPNLTTGRSTDGIFKITPEGTISHWSTAPVSDVTLAPAGDGYAAGDIDCKCILRLDSGGAFSVLHSDVNLWTHTKLAPNGNLYASVASGTGRGLYAVDRTTGAPTLIVTDPSANYGDMAVGPDGRLYLIVGDATGYWLKRLDGAMLTNVASLPHSGIGLTVDPEGTFYTATSFGPNAEVWMISGGTATLFADDITYPAGASFDPVRGRLYVSELYGTRQVWTFTKDVPTPAARRSWGGLKSLYR